MGSPLPSLINNKEKPHTELPKRIYRKINYSDVWQTEWRAKLQLHRCAPTNCSLGPWMAFAMGGAGGGGGIDQTHTEQLESSIHYVATESGWLIIAGSTKTPQPHKLITCGVCLFVRSTVFYLCVWLATGIGWLRRWWLALLWSRIQCRRHIRTGRFIIPFVGRLWLTEFWRSHIGSFDRRHWRQIKKKPTLGSFDRLLSTFFAFFLPPSNTKKKKRHTKKNERRIERKIKVTPERRSSTHEA